MKKNNYKLLLFFLLCHQLIIAQTAPFAGVDYDTADINTTLTVPAPGVLVNDSDGDGDTITVRNFFVNGRSFSAGETASFGQGTITINEDGSYVFVPSNNYTGDVSLITYSITDGRFTSFSNLYLTVEDVNDLLLITNFSSSNQGYTANEEYKVYYSITLTNKTRARDYNPLSLIKNINLTNDLQATFGNGCILSVDDAIVFTSSQPVEEDFVNNPYPRQFDSNAINPNFLDATSNEFFTANAENNFILYPRQSIFIRFCVTVDAFCDGRTDPTPSGSGLDFNNEITAKSNTGNATDTLELTDFHSTEAVLTAGLYVPNTNPPVKTDGSFEYTNTIVFENDGKTTGNNINYNMGLGNFFNNAISFDEIIITQISGPTVTINNSYDGNTNTLILEQNNSLSPGEKIEIEIFFKTNPAASNQANFYSQMDESQTQGALDGFDETIASNKRDFSFVIWSDSSGDHLDRYYGINNPSDDLSAINKCLPSSSFIVFGFTSSASISVDTTLINNAPNGILEHQEITFKITATNTSDFIELKNLQIQDNLSGICPGNIVSFSTPIIESSTATTNPNLNPSYNARTNSSVFDGSSGLLKTDESITVEFTIIFNEDCINLYESSFLGRDPLNNLLDPIPIDFENIFVATDTDNDGITNFNDLDDDNDTIPDINEYNGLNPLGDNDFDSTPNYRDLDFGVDTNNDGIIDVFDFDNDGVPNHFDLDSDNDGILDIVEAGNAAQDTNNNGKTNNSAGGNGLDNNLENSDNFNTSINYTIPNTDNNGGFNFIDIDADDDGIVDNIEAQSTFEYTPPNMIVNEFGIDTAYPNGISPVDTENDTIFDYVDTNSDNDIREDKVEGWDLTNDGIAETLASNSDADNDGLDDAFDSDDNLVNPTNNQVPTDFPNLENIGNPERDWREIIAILVLIDDVSITEGNDLVFTITLVKNSDNTILTESASEININISLTDGTSTTSISNEATAPFDYTEVTTTLNIPPNINTTQITVTSLEDIIYELEEFFTINGTITTNNTVNTSIEGIGSIIDNDPKPTITMNDSMEEEGIDLAHTITISNPSSTPVEVTVTTSDDVAINGEDYTEFSQNITIDATTDQNNANTEVSFNIPTLNDNLNEPDQEALNVIGNVTSTNTGTSDLIKKGIIIDKDPSPIIHVDNLTVIEGNPFDFTITLLNADLEPMQNYLPIAIKLETVNETASFPIDFQRLISTVSIPALTSSISQTVITNEDKLNEDSETLLFRATTIASDVVSISSSEGIGTIKDNDYPNLFSPNNDGKSDLFKISGIEDFPNFKLTIVDRWGNKIHDYSNNGNINPVWWDGLNSGKPVPEGVYFYTLDFNDGITKPRTNFIQLVR